MRRTAQLIAALLISWLLTSLATANRAAFQQAPPSSPEGAALYQQRCAVCHDTAQERVPPLFLIRRRSAEDVIQTLTEGSMKQQAAGLNAEQIRGLAIHLTGKQPGAPLQNLDVNKCKAAPAPLKLTGAQ